MFFGVKSRKIKKHFKMLDSKIRRL